MLRSCSQHFIRRDASESRLSRTLRSRIMWIVYVTAIYFRLYVQYIKFYVPTDLQIRDNHKTFYMPKFCAHWCNTTRDDDETVNSRVRTRTVHRAVSSGLTVFTRDVLFMQLSYYVEQDKQTFILNVCLITNGILQLNYSFRCHHRTRIADLISSLVIHISSCNPFMQFYYPRYLW
jgi:hypothetical protein